MKCVTPLSYDNNGSLRYSLGKLIDLTGLVEIRHFGYKFEEPGQHLLYDSYQHPEQPKALFLNAKERF